MKVEDARDYGHTHLSEVRYITCNVDSYYLCIFFQTSDFVYVCSLCNILPDNQLCRQVRKQGNCFDTLFSSLSVRCKFYTLPKSIGHRIEKL